MSADVGQVSERTKRFGAQLEESLQELDNMVGPDLKVVSDGISKMTTQLVSFGEKLKNISETVGTQKDATEHVEARLEDVIRVRIFQKSFLLWTK